ncbi:MAG: DNA polymerase III subunit alpha [Bacteroidetes bacterium]|nr:MAG: DNA polymerase III subunit alpha [Bacteroidota bacterium]
MYIIFDTETTGLPKNWNRPYTDTDNWPRAVQIAWQLHNEFGELVEARDFLIKPDGFDIPFDSEQIHGISTELANAEGSPLEEVAREFNLALNKAKFVVGQNIGFDINIMGCEFHRLQLENRLQEMPVLDTCTEVTANLCQLPGGRGGKFKLPTLSELHAHLFGDAFSEAHNATADVEATTRCFFELIRREVFTEEELQQELPYFKKFKELHPRPIQAIGLKHINLKEASSRYKDQQTEASDFQDVSTDEIIDVLKDAPFAHLHNHTQFSILQSTTDVQSLVNKTIELGMPAVAITDTGNMMAAFHFEKAIGAHNKKIREAKKEAEEKGENFEGKEIKAIIGSEFNVCVDHLDKSHKDNGYQIAVLAKNRNGYNNLIKLASIAYTEGMYYVPRIDKKLLEQYKEDLIVLSGNIYGEIPQLILNVGEKQAEEALLWWKETFDTDFYLEVMRHGQENENRVNQTLIRFSEKHQVKLVATNNTYYLEQSDADAHDILLCVKANELVNTPIGQGRGFRYGLENQEYYFKSSDQMKALFNDLPEAILNIEEILDKIENYQLARDVLLPAFDIPEEFQDEQDQVDGGKRGENNYLRHLTYEGAKERYDEITDEIRERIDFELETIERTGYPGYFLIVQDFCKAAREMGVSVGPGRGSAAGSAVAYCTGITNVDPIAYNLLFERFLNPDRISMPDIDIDFDDEGRGKVIEWVINKYGANQVAQIITYGTMAAKSSIRDTARAMDLPLFEADRLAKLVPDISLGKLFGLEDSALFDKLKNRNEDFQAANELKRISTGTDLASKVINQARKLEGSVRNTGIHACGVIITPDDITKFVPVATAKDSDMWCTQFDNSVAEEAGLLKMDFLGLKTLTLIKHAVANVEETQNVKLDPDHFPIDDSKTYELFQRGETVGIFQYESPGMQKYMRELKPTVFADLIAMNALYRPGPLEYIPSFIRRKHGEEEIQYDIDACQEYLEETYGITVYQEQVMLLSQKLAGFTKGEADTLRKAMGKKQIYLLDKMKPQFIQQGQERGHDPKALEKIWKDWEAFAAYAFNKSHSTCYAWIAYQTAYLKANYPAEYMASVLSNNMNDIKQVSFFMEECKRIGIPVLGPDVNESAYYFTVNPEGAIRFGLGAIKGLGSAPVEAIIAERDENGPYNSIFDMTKRVNLRTCNKKAFESLALAGGFDSFKGVHRAQYFKEDNSGKIFLENAIRFGANYQNNLNSAQASLFGEASGTEIPEPEIPKAEEWPSMYKLNKEKEVVGIFISGHPLDDFRLEIESFCTGQVSQLHDPAANMGKEVLLACIVTDCEQRMTKRNEPFGTMTIEDYSDAFKLFLFRDNYLKFRPYLVQGNFLAIKGKFEISGYRKEPEFVIRTIELLHDLREKRGKVINLKVSTKNIDQIFISDLNRLFMDHTGNCQVKFTVYDPLEGIQVSMPSKNVRVEVSNDFVKKLDEFDLEFELQS